MENNNEKIGFFKRLLNFLMPSRDEERLKNVYDAEKNGQTVESLTKQFNNACDKIDAHHEGNRSAMRKSAALIATVFPAIAVVVGLESPLDKHNFGDIRFWCYLGCYLEAVGGTGIYAKCLYDWNRANKMMKETYNTLKEKMSPADNKKEIIDQKAKIAKEQNSAILNSETCYAHYFVAACLLYSALKQYPRLPLLCYAGVVPNAAFFLYNCIASGFNSMRINNMKSGLQRMQEKQRT